MNRPINISNLIEAVSTTFDNIASEILDNKFLSLQQIMLETIKIDGSMAYA